ncbi:hypothetical protein [Nonomuraea jiangxiensis]|uniref:hypothetical protein n=1 Tax=Nonomuraea jiangxiensis TaxID=633440 RepID=UPI000B89B5A4|nr:hypothetical protein [Nonomuraea jiangxiensis]
MSRTLTAARARIAFAGDGQGREAAGGAHHPGGEIAVRAVDGLREEVPAIKQLLETGEVLVVEGQPEGHRTLLGRATGPAFRQLTRRGSR